MVAIIGVLAAIVIGTISSARSSARQAGCLANLRQIGMAALLYSQDNNRRTAPPRFYGALTEGGYLPKLTLGDMHAKAGVWMCADDPADRTAMTVTSHTTISYGINTHRVGLPSGGYWQTSKSLLSDIQQPSRTLYFADTKIDSANSTKWWIEKPAANQNASFRHRGKVNVVFFDGHAASITEPASLSTFYDDHM